MINPEPAKNLCFNDKILRLTASTHRISTMERQKCSDTEFVDITLLAMWDLEDENDKIFEWFW